jgi:hypothetical protein
MQVHASYFDPTRARTSGVSTRPNASRGHPIGSNRSHLISSNKQRKKAHISDTTEMSTPLHLKRARSASTRDGPSPATVPCRVAMPCCATIPCAPCCPPRSITRTSNEKFSIGRSVATRSNVRCNIKSVACCNIRTKKEQH